MNHRKSLFKPLPSPSKFYLHIVQSFFFGLGAVILALTIGMLGYHYFEQMNWVDAFLNASMILSGMGPVQPLATIHGKIFAGFYALFSGLTFILIIGIIFAPVIHYFFHKMHIDFENTD